MNVLQKRKHKKPVCRKVAGYEITHRFEDTYNKGQLSREMLNQ